MVNRESTLNREWVAVHDDTMPADLIGTPGVTTFYRRGKPSYPRGEYRYKAHYSIEVKEPIVAIKVRFITFDIWDGKTGALETTKIRDFAPGSYSFTAEWKLYSENDSENEAAEHYASVSYISAVRTARGEIHHADAAAITDVASRYTSDLTSDLLDEDRNPRRRPTSHPQESHPQDETP